MGTTVEAKLGHNVFKIDKERHIVINTEICNKICKDKTASTSARRSSTTDDQGNNTVDRGLPGVRHLPDLAVNTTRSWSIRGRVRHPVPECLGGANLKIIVPSDKPDLQMVRTKTASRCSRSSPTVGTWTRTWWRRPYSCRRLRRHSR